MTQIRIRLITRGDDSGMCPSANQAVLEAFRNGILRNASVMVPCPHFSAAAEMFRGLDELCIGLHATLNAEWDTLKWGPVLPPAQVPSLVDEEGHFLQNPHLLKQRGFSVAEAMAEISAQLAHMRVAGLQPAYLDTHMAFTWVSQELEQELAAFARREGLIHGRPVKGLPGLDEAEGDPVDRFLARLDAAPPGVYLFVTHPGFDNEEMQQFGHQGLAPGQVAREREWDRRLLTDPRVLDYCAAQGIEPVRWMDV